MKKKRIFLSTLFLAVGLSFFAACDGKNKSNDASNDNQSGSKEEEKIVPTYQGMAIKKLNIGYNFLALNDQPNKEEKGNDHDNGWHNGWHGKEGNEDEEYLPSDYDTPSNENDIEDVLELEVITDDEIKYYVKPNEDFLIHVKINNPSNFEILSFTLNNKTYSSYMFEDGSDMENLYLRVTAPEESGYTEYTIDSIKYVDDTEIKNVDLSTGMQTIKAGIRYEDLPVANASNISSTSTSVSFNVTVNDTSRLIKENDIKIYLSDGDAIVAEKELAIGSNHIEFDSLELCKYYDYIVVAKYDACDGKDLSYHTLLKGGISTKGSYEFGEVVATKDSVSFEINKFEEIGNISYIAVFDKENENSVVLSLEDLTLTTIDGLLSNHSYILYAEYSYTKDEEEFKYYIYKDFNTEEKQLPNIGIKINNLDEESISGSIIVSDLDSIFELNEIRLYLNNSLVETSNSADFSFDILSNANYKLVIYYSYDLNDGNGRLDKEYIYEFTSGKLIPELSVIINDINDKNVSFDVVEIDKNQVGSISLIKLFEEDILVKNVSLTDYNLTNLKPRTNYKLVVSYDYDLNDGSGVHSFDVEIPFTTWNEQPSVSIDLTSTTSKINYNFIYNDNSSTLEIEEVELIKNNVVVSNNSTINGEFLDLLSDNEYIIKVKYSYINYGDNRETLSVEKSISTKKITEPTVGINVTNMTSDSVVGSVVVSDFDSVCTINSIDLYLNSNLIDTSTSQNSFIFSTTSNVTYEIKVNYSYDLNDGNGQVNKEYVYEFTSGKVIPQLSIMMNEINDKNAIFDLIEIDKNQVGSISLIKLFEDDTLIRNVSLTDYNLTNLKPGTNYKLVVSYEYDLNDGNGSHSFDVEKEFKTWNEQPIISMDLSSTINEINYSLLYNDNSSTLEIEEVELVKDGVVIAYINDISGSFNDLLSDNEYIIKAKYSYINYGDNREILYIEKSINTKKIDEPSVGVNVTNISFDSIEGTIVISDFGSNCTINSINLYQNNSLIASAPTALSSFKFNTVANVTYEIKVNYSYNLNDGTGVKNNTINKIVTTSKIAPTVSINAYNISQNTINYDLIITDPNARGNLQSIRLFKGNNFIKNMNQFDYEINNLDSNSNYRIEVAYNYDLDDGIGARVLNYEYEFKTLKVEPILSFGVSEKTKTSVTILEQINDYQQTLTFKSIQLLKNGQIVDTSDEMIYKFENLLSNTQYEIIINYEKDLNNGPVNDTYYLNFKTLKMNTPSVDICLTSTKNSISYSYEIYDTDNISTFKSIELYRNGVKVDLDSEDNKFNDLLSNTEYEVKVILECDYNDGLEPVIKEYSSVVKTEELVKPELKLEFDSDLNSIEAIVKLTDVDNVFTIKNIEFYDGSELIETFNDVLQIVKTNLASNTIYTVKVNYSYNLNDGTGDVEESFIDSFSTLASEIKVDHYEILTNESIKTEENINVKLYLDNPSSIEVLNILVNGQTVDISNITKDYIIFVIKAPKISGDFDITITRFTYELNSYVVNQDVFDSEPITVEIESRLGIININTFDGLDIVNTSNQSGLVITVDNSDGYKVESCKINGTAYNIIVIDDNHFYVSININYSGNNTFRVDSITYSEDDEIIVRNYNDDFTFVATLLNPTESYGIEVNKISTPEDLLNIESGKSYELITDIDMSGYNWKMKSFNGYFNGNGHTISNISMIIENEYQYNQSYSLFSSLNGTFKNVYFNNVYVSIQSKGYIYFDILSNNSNGEISNVIYKGSLNIDTTSYDIRNRNNLNIIDNYKVNSNNYSSFDDYILDSSDFTQEYKEEVLGWKFVEQEINEFDGFEYTIIDNSYIFIDKYSGNDSEIEIPTEINNLPVLGIRDLAFANNTNLKRIVFGDNIIHMGGDVLNGCSNLESLVTSNSDLKLMFGTKEYDNSYLPEENEYYNNHCYIPNTLKNLEFTNKNSTIYLAKYKSLETVILPNGLTTIEYQAFYHCDYLKNVVLPNSIENISDWSFVECYKLGSIVIPSSVKTIGNYAFGSSEIKNVYYNGTIDDWVNINFSDYGSNPIAYSRKIYILDENGAISYNDKTYSLLTNVTISGDNNVVRKNAFRNCNVLNSVVVLDGVNKLDEEVFYGCVYINCIALPKSLTSIGNSCFNGTGFGVIYYAGSEEEWNSISIGERNDSLDNATIIFNTSITSIETKEVNNVKYIESSNKDVYVLEITDNTIESLDLETMLDGYNVTLKDDLFRDFTNLKSVTLPNSITEINDCLFYGCTSLKTIEIPDEVTNIGIYAFYNCTSLKTIVMSNATTSIGEGAFNNCASLISIEIPNEVTIISRSLFNGCTNLISVSIPDSVKSIESNAFSNCINLSSVILPENLISLGSTTFYSCKLLKEINIPENVKVINVNSFMYCSQLERVSFGKSITTIDTQAFYGCDKLSELYYDGSIDDWFNISFTDWSSKINHNSIKYYFSDSDGIIEHNGKKYSSLENVIIPNDILTVDDRLMKVSTIKEVHIQSGTLNIGSQAFNNCSNLKTVIIDEGVTSILDSAFSYDNIRFISLPKSIESISLNAFACTVDYIYYAGTEEEWNTISIAEGNYGLTNAKIIFNSSFNSAKEFEENNVKYVKLSNNDIFVLEITDDTIESLDLETMFDGYNVILKDALFRGFTNLKSITLPSVTKEISNYLFYGCTSLTSVVIPNSAARIGYEAFRGCSKLESVIIPSSVKSISDCAFYDCSKLKSIIIPEGVTEIGYEAFRECSKLESIVIPASMKTIESYVFVNCNKLMNVYYDGTINDWLDMNVSDWGSNPMAYSRMLYILDENGDVTYNGKTYSLLTNVTISGDNEVVRKHAFRNCNVLDSVVILDGVTKIGDEAFNGCNYIRYVTLPSTIEEIGNNCFNNSIGIIYYAGSEEDWNNINIGIDNGALENATIIFNTLVTSIETKEANYVKYLEFSNKDVFILEITDNTIESLDLETMFDGYNVTIKGELFRDFTNLKTITLPSTIKEISSYLFYGCTSLIGVVIPDNVTKIWNDSFGQCNKLESIVIPSSVKSIDGYAFKDCSKLTNIYYNGTLEDWCNIGFKEDYSNPMTYAKNIYFLDEDGLIEYNGNNYSTVEEITIDSSMNVQKFEFRNFSSLKNVTILDDVTNIPEGFFYGCTSLESVTIPNSVVTIDRWAFYKCSKLTSIIIPNQVTEIGYEAFYECSKLESIVIPASVSTIATQTFLNCSKLMNVYYDGTIDDWLDMNVSDWGSNPMAYSRKVYILDEDGDISYNGKTYSLLTNVTISGDNEVVRKHAFRNCNVLDSVVFLDGVTKLDEEAFYGCDYIGYVALPKSITTIENNCFINSNIGVIYYAGSEEEWNNIDISIGNDILYDTKIIYNTAITSIETKEENNVKYVELSNKDVYVLEITENTIESLDLETMFDGYNVMINNGAFNNANNLRALVLTNGLTKVYDYAFSSCSNLSKVYYYGTEEEWNNITINNNGNGYLTNANRYYYSETEPTEAGNYWHYVDGIVTIWE